MSVPIMVCEAMLDHCKSRNKQRGMLTLNFNLDHELDPSFDWSGYGGAELQLACEG